MKNWKSNLLLPSFEEGERLRISTHEATKVSEHSRKPVFLLPNRVTEITCLKALRDYLKSKGKMGFGDINYTNVRLYEFMKVYMGIKSWVDTPWSSIKGLFCNLMGFAVPSTVVN
jgi:hypothetical protein